MDSFAKLLSYPISLIYQLIKNGIYWKNWQKNSVPPRSKYWPNIASQQVSKKPKKVFENNFCTLHTYNCAHPMDWQVYHIQKGSPPRWSRLPGTSSIASILFIAAFLQHPHHNRLAKGTDEGLYLIIDLSSLLGCRFWTRLLGSWKHVSRSQYVLIRKLWEIKVWFLYLKESSKEWWYTCAHHVGFYTIP